MKKLASLAIIATLTGCASQEELTILTNNSMHIANAQKAVATNQQATLAIDCSQGCGKTKITYLDPRDRQQVTGSRVKGTNDVLIESFPSIVKGIGYVAGAIAVTKIASDVADSLSASGGGTVTHNTTTVNGSNNNTTGTTSVARTETSSSISEANNNRGDGNSVDGNSFAEDNDTTSTTNNTTTDNTSNTTTNTTDTQSTNSSYNTDNTNNSNQGNPIDNTNNSNNSNNSTNN